MTVDYFRNANFSHSVGICLDILSLVRPGFDCIILLNSWEEL